ncbi:hypothetical protein EDC96DRAFT_518497 [Choanephora cucurbitarum]|nr:hypothetical protein EDC96DRAFT_518497 [Choanephora cucurbitarum]
MHRLSHRFVQVTKTSSYGFHTSAARSAITRFNLPAMSPTMTEGTIHRWVKKEGESFAAGDVLLELETDKAQIDVEAADDGVLAKIVLPDGTKGAVNSLIALIAEEGDDISNVEIPAEETSNSAPVQESKEDAPTAAATPATARTPAVAPISHHDIDTSKLKKSLSPAVLSLILKYGIKDVGSIKPSGHGGRILKGDVLAHLGLIAPKPAPKPTLTAAPPRDQIVFAKSSKPAAEKSVEKEQIVVDDLFKLRQSLNEQHGTFVSVNDFIAKAAERALQEITTHTPSTPSAKKPVVHQSTASAFSEKYTGGQFKIFNLSEPAYDFITDSYQVGKPYVMTVGANQRIAQPVKSSANNDMLDLIDYLGGSVKQVQERRVQLTTKNATLDFANQPKQGNQYHVQVKLDGGVPGKILANAKANAFLDRVEYYVRNPNELVA